MIELNKIGIIRSPFKEKFGLPRQSGICPDLAAQIILERNRFNEEAIRDLDQYSHIWIIFHFHLLKKTPDKARIRPPRLGGNKYVGVYSSRSPYRPNPIGLSLVQLTDIVLEEKKIILNILGHDLLDETPILDIKPYISTDIPEKPANFGWQETKWETLKVEFADSVVLPDDKKKIIVQILQQDPRPAYDKNKENQKTFHMTVDNLNISFQIRSDICTVTKVSLRKH